MTTSFDDICVVTGVMNSFYDSDCYVATEAYQGKEHPYVKILREIRDKELRKSYAGKALIAVYYGGLGRVLAHLIKKHMPEARKPIRDGLSAIVRGYLRHKPEGELI